MIWSAPVRCAQCLFVLLLAASAVGCPELNTWSGPGYQNDPFLTSTSGAVPGSHKGSLDVAGRANVSEAAQDQIASTDDPLRSGIVRR